MRLIVEKWILASLYAKANNEDEPPEADTQQVDSKPNEENIDEPTVQLVNDPNEPDSNQNILSTNQAQSTESIKDTDLCSFIQNEPIESAYYTIRQPNIFIEKYERDANNNQIEPYPMKQVQYENIENLYRVDEQPVRFLPNSNSPSQRQTKLPSSQTATSTPIKHRLPKNPHRYRTTNYTPSVFDHMDVGEQIYAELHLNEKSWHSFLTLVNAFRFRSTTIDSAECEANTNELNKLNCDLLNETELFDLQDQYIFFNSQQKLIDFINNQLRDTLFKLSQSRAHFDCTGSRLVESIAQCPELLSYANKLKDDYFDLFDSLKTRIKLKINKFESYLYSWNSLNKTCTSLDTMFLVCTTDSDSDIQYYEHVLKINENLTKLKEEFNILTPILDNNLYKNIQNQIILYELKLNQIGRKFNKQLKPETHTRLICTECLGQQKPKTMCAKCIERVNNVSTQTARSYTFTDDNEPNYTTSPDDSSSVNNYELLRTSKNRYKQKSRKNSNTNGKQLLLEAYLSKNTTENLNLFKTETTTTHESGMGTFNEEDDDDEYENIEFNQKFNLKSQNVDCKETDTQKAKEQTSLKKVSNKADKNSMKHVCKQLLLNECLKKFLSFLITFLMLLLIIVSYHIYYMFNPVCCDFKRNYLFLNLT